jgi:hypothetical protein
MTNIDKVWIDEAEAMANNKLTGIRIAEIAADGFLEHGDAKSMAAELQEYRKAATPIYQLRDWHWYDAEKRIYDEVTAAGGEGRIVYTAPQPDPAPAVEVEQRRNPVLAYADSYREMAKRGVESIPVWSVITDLERNIAPHFTAPAVEAVSLEVAGFTCTICGRTTTHPEGWHYCKKGNEND